MKIKTALKLIWGCDVVLWGHDEYSWGQRSIPGHVFPSEATMNMHEVRGWDFKLEVKMQLRFTHTPELTSGLMQTHCDLRGWCHTQMNFKPVLIFIDLAQLHFWLAYKNSQRVIIDCHTPVISQLGEDKVFIYLIKREYWPNTLYCLFLFDTPCIHNSATICV